VVKRLRETGIFDFLSRATVVLLFALLSINLLREFLRTGHVTGLLLLASESLVVVLTIARRRAAVIDSSAKAATVTGVSLVGPWMLRAADAGALVPDNVTSMISGVGLLIVVASKMALGRSFGLVPANRGVVVRGPYGVVRHPIYLALFLYMLSFGIAFGHFVQFIISVPLYIVGAAIRVREEEKLLRAQFGEEHAHYVREVPAFFPLIR